MNGTSSSVRVDGGPTSLTIFGMIAEPLALPYRDDALVDKGTEAPKPCLAPVKMRTPTAAGGLLPAAYCPPASLYSDEDRLSPTVSLKLLPDRSDKVSDDGINADIRHVQQLVANKGLRNKIKAKCGI